MLIIGLTGSIATGKSTVSRLLSSPPYNLPLVDADVLAREVVEPGTAGYKKIVAHFGEGVLQPASESETESGSGAERESGGKRQGRPLDRAALGRLVFGSSAAATANRKVLNGIVHPAVRARMAAGVVRAWLGGSWAVVLDVPLLFESGLDVYCGAVLLVGVRDSAVPLQRQRARARAQGGSMTESEARGRVASQGALAWKLERVERRRAAIGPDSAAVVWNDAGLDDLRAEVDAVVSRWRAASPPWWCTLLWLVPPVGIAVAAWGFVRAWWVRRECLRREQAEGKGK